MIGRRQKVWGVLLLLALLLAAVSCDRTSTNSSTETENQGNDNSYLAYDVELSSGRNVVRNYLGKKDTLLLTAQVTDVNQVGVQNAKVTFKIISGPGAISRIDSTTDYSGNQRANYIVNLTSVEDQTVIIETSCNGISDQKEIGIKSLEVHLSSSADPATQRKAVGLPVEGTVTLNVTDNGDIGISGIPVRIEKTSVEWYDQESDSWSEYEGSLGGLIIQPVSVTNTDGQAQSKISLNPLPDFGVRINVKTSISLPPSDGTEKANSSNGIIKLGNKIKDMIGKGEAGTAGGEVEHTTAANDTVDTTTITFLPFTGVIDRMDLWADQQKLVVPVNQSAQTILHISAQDGDGKAIDSLAIGMEIIKENSEDQVGIISHITVTDSSGIATARLNTNRKYGTWNIRAFVGSSDNPIKEAFTVVSVDTSASESYNLEMHLSTDRIYADNGITTARVNIRLTDQDQIAVSGDTIRFATKYGYTPGQVFTDSTGRVSVEFSDVGDTAIYQPATVTAMYRKNGIVQASVTREITIDHVPLPEQLVLTIPTNSFIVSATDSIPVTVLARTGDNEFVTPGTPIRFAVNGGNAGFFSPETTSTDENSRAVSYYFWGTRAADDVQLIAYSEQNGEIYSSNNVDVTINPGSATYIWAMYAERQTMLNNDPDPNLVHCAVVDTFLNPVSDNVGIIFSSDKGTITGSATTNENGEAITQFTAGTEAGVAKIKAELNALVADSIYINVLPGGASSLSLASNVDEIMVAQTGGVENATITATVVDGSGNPVMNENVHFLLKESPRDSTGTGQRVQCKLGGFDGSNTTDPEEDGFTPYRHPVYGYGLPYAIVTTNNGIAQVSVTSGTAKGPILLEAWVYQYDDHDEMIDSSKATFSGLQVVAGPPDDLEIDVNMDGDDLLGAAFALQVSARVQDARGNDVANGYAIVFGTNNPEIHIGEGITGNYNADGDSSAGVAYTTLTYHSAYTNTEVTIYASVVRPNGENALDEFTFKLPIQGPQGLLYTDIMNFNYTVRATDIAVFDIECYVMDDHEHWIDNALVRFLTNKGKYYSQTDIAGDWVPAFETEEEYTGYADRLGLDTHGWADLFLVITQQEGFPEPVAETTAEASAEIVGYSDAGVEPVMLTLYQ